MKTKNPRTNAKALLSLALISFFAPAVFAAGIATTEDELITTTLGDNSGYTLVKLDSSNSTNLDITKYLIDVDENGDIINTSEVNYAVDLKDIILDSSGTDFIYYTWEKSDSGEISLLAVDSIEGLADYEYFSVQYNASGSASAEAVSNTDGSTIDYITGDFIGKADSTGMGGAIYNYSATIGVDNSSAETNGINGNFIGNSTTYSSYAYGGAIFNYAAYIYGGITGNFISNYASSSSYAYGGAIANFGGVIYGGITGDFVGNYANTDGDYALGGAIYNTNYILGGITGDFVGNYATSTGASSSYSYAYGGAIYNKSYIYGGITGDFISNYVSTSASYALGGAIYNNSSIYGGITGDFIGNYASSTYNYVYGGAIYNTGTIDGGITGDFIGNYSYTNIGTTFAYSYSTGGAIYNGNSIVSISGDFTDNVARNDSTYGRSYGGAIYNSGTIGYVVEGEDDDDDVYYGIEGNFTNNSAFVDTTFTSSCYALGGAIVNTSSGVIYLLSGDFISNTSTSGSLVAGGAIYNEGKIYEIEGDFYTNYAKSTKYQAHGGAIYNAGAIYTIIGNFEYNYAYSTLHAAMGGAITNFYNALVGGEPTAYIESIIGNFTANSTQTISSQSYGGAIANISQSTLGYANIDSIYGTFTSNYTYAAYYYAWGGAIINFSSYSWGGDNASTINYIGGEFIANSVYFTNTSTSSDSILRGGAIYNHNSYIGTIEADFYGNSAYSNLIAGSTNSIYAQGGAVANRGNNAAYSADYDVNDYYALIDEIIGDFSSNYVYAKDGYAQGGAIYNYGVIGSVEGAFTSNYANVASDDDSALGGAIYIEANSSTSTDLATAITLTSSEGTEDEINEIVNLGNFATTKTLAYDEDGNLELDEDGFMSSSANTLTTVDDENGGFLYIAGVEGYVATANFDTAAYSSIIIGNGTVGYDSIASSDATAVINKTGEGDLIVNSSMAYYYGALNVEEGYMEYNNEAALSLYSLDIDEGASFGINATTLSSSTIKNDDESTALSALTNDGTLVLTGGELTVALDLDGTIESDISYLGSVSVSADIISLTGGELSSTENLNTDILNITGEVSSTAEISDAYTLTIGEDGVLSTDAALLTLGSISNDGVVSLSGTNADGSTSGILTASIEGEGDIEISADSIITADAVLLGSSVINNSTLILVNADGDSAMLSVSITEGSSTNAVVIAGAIEIDEDASIETDSLTVNSEASLETNATSINSADSITNAGTITLTSGELTTVIAADGEGSVVNLGDDSTDTVSVSANITASEINVNVDVANEGILTATTTLYIDEDASLETNASFLASDVTNEGELILTGGLLSVSINDENNLLGTVTIDDGSVFVDDDSGAIYADTLQISEDGTLTIVSGSLGVSEIINDGALNMTSGYFDDTIVITNNSEMLIDVDEWAGSNYIKNTDEITIQGIGTLSSSIAKSGDETSGDSVLIASDGDTASSVILGASIETSLLSIEESNSLSANADYLDKVDSIANAGTVNLTGGTLDSAIAGEGDVSATDTVIDASISATNVDLAGETTVNDTVSASDIDVLGAVSLGEDGILNASDTIAIEDGASLTANADSLIATNGITNAGTLSLTGGDLVYSLSNSGTLRTTAAYISSTDLTNTGTLNLRDGDYVLNGTTLGGEVALSGDASLSVIITTTNATLTTDYDSANVSYILNDIELDDYNSDTTTVTVTIEDIFTVLGTTNAVYDMDNESVILDYGTYADDYDGISISDDYSTIIIADTVSLKSSSDSDSSLGFSDENGNTITTKGDYDLTDQTISSDILDSSDGSLTIGDGATVETGTIADDSTVDVAEGGSLSAGSVSNNVELSVSGGDLYLGDTESSDATTVALQNNDGAVDLSVTDYDSAVEVSATSGSVTVLTETVDCNILYTGGDYDLDEGSTLELNTTGSENTVAIYGDNSVSGDDATIQVNSVLALAENSSLTVDTDLALAQDATLDDGSTLTINSGLASADEDSSTVIIAASSTGEGTTLEIGLNDDNTTTLSVAVETENIETINLAGDISAEQTTAITITTASSDESIYTTLRVDSVSVDFTSTEDLTAADVESDNVIISGDISASADAASSVTTIKVSNSTGTITLSDGTSISATNGDDYGTAITNYHDEDSAGDSVGLTIVLEGSAYITGDIVANSPLYLSVTGGAGDLVVAGSEITTNANENEGDIDTITIGEGATLYLTTDDAGTMANIVNSGAIIADEFALSILGSASMLLDQTYQIADKDTVDNQGSEGISYEDIGSKYLSFYVALSSDEDNEGAAIITVTELTYFQETSGDDANASALAAALDGIIASDDEEDNAAKVAFKVAADNAGLDSYIMHNKSYLAEVNTMLLSNVSYANINRAKVVLAQNRGAYMHESIDDVNNDASPTEGIVPSSYENLAQLQVISYLGSKNASNGVAGYNYWSAGALAAIDAVKEGALVAGISMGGVYSKVEGDSNDSANSTAFLLNAYAIADVEEYNSSIFANISYAHFWNEGSSSASRAEWDSDALSFLIGLSYNINTGVEGLTLSPTILFNLVLLDDEEASYSNDVEADGEIYLSAKLMLGIELEYAISARFKSILRLMYAHEFGDESYDMSYGFSNGYLSNIDYTGGEAGADSAVLGFGLSYDFCDYCAAYLDYNAYIYADLISHSLSLSLGYKF